MKEEKKYRELNVLIDRYSELISNCYDPNNYLVKSGVLDTFSYNVFHAYKENIEGFKSKAYSTDNMNTIIRFLNDQLLYIEEDPLDIDPYLQYIIYIIIINNYHYLFLNLKGDIQHAIIIALNLCQSSPKFYHMYFKVIFSGYFMKYLNDLATNNTNLMILLNDLFESVNFLNPATIKKEIDDFFAERNKKVAPPNFDSLASIYDYFFNQYENLINIDTDSDMNSFFETKLAEKLECIKKINDLPAENREEFLEVVKFVYKDNNKGIIAKINFIASFAYQLWEIYGDKKIIYLSDIKKEKDF